MSGGELQLGVKRRAPRNSQGYATPANKKAHSYSSDVCCACYGTYQDDVEQQSGKEWVQCSCKRWLHEDCAIDCIVDASGNEMLCSFCICTV